MSLTVQSAIVPTVDGQPISIARNQDKYVVSRRSRGGRQNHIALAKADAIALCDALIDYIEEQVTA